METCGPIGQITTLEAPALPDLSEATSRIMCPAKRGGVLPESFGDQFKSLVVRSKSAFEPDHDRLYGNISIKNRDTERKTEPPPVTKGSKSKRKAQKSLSPTLVFITVTEPQQIKTRTNQKLINHHSMKEALKKEKLEGIRRLKTSKYLSNNRSPRDTSPAYKALGLCSCRLSRSPENAAPDLESSPPLTCMACGHRIQSLESGDMLSDRQAWSLLAQSTNPSPKSLLGAGRVDPFQTYPAKGGTRVDFLIDYYVTSLERIASPLVGSNEVGTHSAYLSTIFSIGFVNAAFFNTLLCSVSFVTNAGKMTAETYSYKGEAIRLLNERLHDPSKATDDASLATIIGLANFDCRTDDRASCEAHMNGVAQMVKLRPRTGTSENDLMVRCVFWVDLLTAVLTGRPRFFTHETFSELHWTLPRPPKLNWLTSEAFPQGFLSHLPALDIPLLSVIQDLIFLKDSILASAASRRTSKVPMSLIQQFDNGAASIDSRLHDLQHLYVGDLHPNPTADPVKECVRLTLSLLSNALFNDSWDAPFMLTHFATKLASALFRTNLAMYWDEHIELLLWVLFVGGAYAPAESQLRGTYVALIADARAWLGPTVETWEQVEGILGSFVWERNVSRGRGRMLWAEVEEVIGAWE